MSERWEQADQHSARLGYDLCAGWREHGWGAGFELDDVDRIAAEWTSGSDEPDFVWLLVLKDGRWAAATGWHDYTGWDCQSGFSASVHLTRDDALRWGLTLRDREAIGCLLSDDPPMCPAPSGGKDGR